MTDAIVFTLHCTGHGAWFKQNQEGEVQQINASTPKFANIFQTLLFLWRRRKCFKIFFP